MVRTSPRVDPTEGAATTWLPGAIRSGCPPLAHDGVRLCAIHSLPDIGRALLSGRCAVSPDAVAVPRRPDKASRELPFGSYVRE